MAFEDPVAHSPVTSSASPGSDYDLENIFSSIYGFEAIIVCFFLATACVINEVSLLMKFGLEC
jgi:hypothetical protein